MQKIKITNIIEGSIADDLGIKAGDLLLSVNGKVVEDVFDYRFLCADSNIVLKIEKADGEVWEFEIEKDEFEDLGFEFENSLLDEEKCCRNKCIFCFIDQLPRGMRPTLYFKDDDARLSFLFGNYITTTNLSDDEIERIIRYRMSPVNISIHTTNPELRKRMLNNRFAGDILEKVRRFTENGIMVNSQIVLCPGINDKEELDRTLMDITPLYPHLHSVSVVPVGLTRFRDGLALLKPFDRDSANELLDQLEAWQNKLLNRYGSRIVYSADEFYIMAGRKLPPYEAYEDFPQIENGVGMVSSLIYEVNEALSDYRGHALANRVVSIATGTSIYPYIKSIAELFEKSIKGLKINVYPVENEFFGKTITVTGLLTGKDIMNQLMGKELGDRLLLSRNMFKSGTDIMLDDINTDMLRQDLGTDIRIVDTSGHAFLDALVQS